MEDKLKRELQHLDGVKADWNVIMAEHTSLRVGGPVFCLLRPLDLAGLQTAVQVLNQNHYPYFILGRGTNLLVQDAGMRAVAISLEEGFSQVAYIDGKVKAGAGLRLSRLLRFCLQQSLSGLEFIAGIPGSVGGALRMNAGTQAGEMADVCDSVYLVLSDGALVRLERAKLPFAYRRLELPSAAVVVEAEFLLTPGSREQIRRRIRSLLQVRKEKQPWLLPSAGSVFKNPAGDFAGRLIEAVGLKGVRIGDAQISTVHANFIVNRGQARAEDILALIHLAQDKVAREFGVHLELEIEVVGNNHNLQ